MNGVISKIFFNGTIYTMNPNYPIAEAVAVRKNGMIKKVGTLEDCMKLKRESTTLIDLKGKTMLPGFIDPHTHFTFCQFYDWIDLGPYLHSNLD